jgi:3-dehydroquinate synthase
MKIIKLNLKKRSYNIIVGPGAINRLGGYLTKLNLGQDAYIITNAPINKRYGNELRNVLQKSNFNVRFKVVPDTEESKSIKMFASCLQGLADFDTRRRVFVIAFGGGVVGDLSGFVASVYKRGVAWIQVPTTLLAQVDSSIGGKTGIDLPQGKNLAGAFYQPRLVLSDTRFLRTLSLRQMRSGMAEVIKYAVIADKNLFSYLEKKQKDALKRKLSTLEYVVGSCSYIKASIVQRDEREEKGLRTILNFGHTIGHAIEAASRYRLYNHGEAIALGLLVAVDISRALNMIGEKLRLRIEDLIKAIGLPHRIKGISLSSIINAQYRDKKFIGPRNRFVLIKGISKTEIIENIPLKVIEAALEKRF